MSTRDRILDAAAEVMRTLGLARTTTREIAKAAGFSEATLYKHFDNKEALFLSVLTERMPNFVSLMMRLRSLAGKESVAENLSMVASGALVFYGEILPIGMSVFSSPELLDSLRTLLKQRQAGPQRANESLAAYLRAEQALGRLSPSLEPETGAAMLLGACFQRAYFSSFLGDPISEDEASRFVQGLVANLLCLPHPRSSPDHS